ncbi:MAG: hypothetical protein HY304_00815 [candidate division Zixibacteria bacterium]|nr:hypothetical protein [candidate division Zixibacteria bacterium]
MKHKRWILAAGAVAVGIGWASPPSVCADEKKEEKPWYETYSGHEMWNTNLSQALAISTKDNKPLLVDFYKRH